MRIMVITVDGKEIESSVSVDNARLVGVLNKLRSLWWVKEAWSMPSDDYAEYYQQSMEMSVTKRD